MSNLLYPGPIQGQTFSGAPPVQQQPMIPQQQMQQPAFAQRFKQNMGPILQALGMGIAANNLGVGAAAIPGLTERRQQQMMQQQEMAQEQQRRNATVEWLKTKDPEVANMVAQGMIDPLSGVRMAEQRKQAQLPGNQPASIQEYEYAKQNGFTGSFMDFQEGKRGQGVTYGTTPQWYRVGNEWKYGVTGTDGTFKEVQTPPGVKLEGPEGVAAARSRGTAVGEASGAAAATLPLASATAKRALQMADELVAHPSFNSAVGPIQGRLPDWTAGRADFASRVQQLEDITFMQARKELKGGGAITDFEGEKAQNALNRAKRATSEEDYRRAIEDYKQAIITGYQMLEEQAAMAGNGASPAASAPAGNKRLRFNPATGELE